MDIKDYFFINKKMRNIDIIAEIVSVLCLAGLMAYVCIVYDSVASFDIPSWLNGLMAFFVVFSILNAVCVIYCICRYNDDAQIIDAEDYEILEERIYDKTIKDTSLGPVIFLYGKKYGTVKLNLRYRRFYKKLNVPCDIAYVVKKDYDTIKPIAIYECTKNCTATEDRSDADNERS